MEKAAEFELMISQLVRIRHDLDRCSILTGMCATTPESKMIRKLFYSASECKVRGLGDAAKMTEFDKK